MNTQYIDNSSQSLVSVIVPSYNVEKYIRKCLTSISNQTYLNVEIIVINDGSTDKTGQIVDEIAQLDSRVHVFHKRNMGVSAARNSGITMSSGDYLIFVDGDDYLAPDYIEYMMSLVHTTKAEFCLSKYCFTRSGEKQIKDDEVQVLNSEDATALLLSPEIIVGCWNKIYKRSLITDNKVSFSTNLFYGEGLTFITTISQLADSIGIGHRKVYYYRRNNEASATTKFDIQKLHNGEKALNNIKNNLLVKTSKIMTMYNLHLSIFSLGAVVKIKTNNLEKEYSSDYKKWRKNIVKSLFTLVFSREVSIYRKLLLIGGAISPKFMATLDTKRRKNIALNSVDE